MIIREITPNEYPILETFLYEAIHIPPGKSPVPWEMIYLPEIFVYIKDFGKKDDMCLVAEHDSVIVGAAWTRIIPAYGHIDDQTPELAISILPEYRGQGVGAELLSRLFDVLKERGYKQTSLSVQKTNPAFRLYQRIGYVIVDENEEDYIMVKKL